MENVVFTYQRTKEDIMTQNVWQTFWRNRVVRVLTFFFPILGIVFLVNNIRTGADAVVYIAVTYLVLYPLINYMMIKLRVNRYFRDPNITFDVTTFDYSKAGIDVHSDKGDLLLEWDHVVKVYNTKEYIYVFVDNRSSIMVKKDIISELQVEFILKLLKDNVSWCNY